MSERMSGLLYLYHALPALTQRKFAPCGFSQRFVIKLRGDVQALGFSQVVAGNSTNSTIIDSYLSGHQSKFGFMYFFPCFLHVSDCLQHKVLYRDIVI